LVPSFDSGDDFVGVFGPDEGLGIGVGIGDEVVDCILEVLEGTEDATLEAALGQEREQTALSQEAEVGVKWKTKRGWRASHSITLGCLCAA
jgi:hypothetical protein